MKRKEAEQEKRLEMAAAKLEEAKSQTSYLKDQMAASKVEADLQLEKLRMEQEGCLANLQLELDNKATMVRQLKDDLASRGEEMEFLREELQAKKEELEEVFLNFKIFIFGLVAHYLPKT